jgi:tetratricopeptide (TPR) repeat protein
LDFSAAEREAARLVADVEAATSSSSRLYRVSAADPVFYLPRALAREGVALLCLGRHEQAEPFFRRALDLRSDYHEARYELAVTLCALGRHADALVEARKCVALSPDSGKSYRLAGMILARSGRRQEAMRYLQRSLEVEPGDVIAELELAWLLATAPEGALRDGKRAVELAQRVCRMTGGGNHRALDVLAAAYAECGHFDRAARTAEKALDLSRPAFREPAALAREDGVSILRSMPRDLEERIRFYRGGKPWREQN